VLLGAVELFVSFLSLSDYCTRGDNTARVAHLTVAGTVFTASVLVGVVTRQTRSGAP
jgi:hypothetical protein